MIDILKYFDEPVSQRQKQYETVRAVVKDRLSIKAAAGRFGYKVSTVNSILERCQEW